MDNFESVKNANCLYTDEAGRLWIGTNDSGLSICINDNIANVLDESDRLGADSVRCITQGADGRYYIGTTGSMSVVTLSGGLSVDTNIEEIVYAYSVSADTEGNVAVVTDEGVLYLVRGTEVVASYQNKENGFTCCQFTEDGSLYVGTEGNKIIRYAVTEDGLKERKTINCAGISEAASLTIQEGLLYICAYNGAGYLDANERYHEIKMNQFNSSLEHVLIDYQGNYWFVSSRFGLLRMCQSVFTDINTETGLDAEVVNSTAYWQGDLYIGMDNGLVIVDGDWNRKIQNELTQELEGVRIRNLMVDSQDTFWIATTGKGIYQVSHDSSFTVYDETVNTNGQRFRSLEDGLSSGVVMRLVKSMDDEGVFVVTSNSLSYMDADGNIRACTNFPYYNNFDIVERQDGTLFVLSSAGIYVVDKKELLEGGELEYKRWMRRMKIPASIRCVYQSIRF